MTYSFEYQMADAFKRKLMREIKAGKDLINKGWDIELPADVHTLESVLKWYDRHVERENKKEWKDYGNERY